MRFFYIARTINDPLNHFNGIKNCVYVESDNIYSFNALLDRSRLVFPNNEYIEIPESCVRKVYGKSWPRGSMLCDYIAWQLPWPTK